MHSQNERKPVLPEDRKKSHMKEPTRASKNDPMTVLEKRFPVLSADRKLPLNMNMLEDELKEQIKKNLKFNWAEYVKKKEITKNSVTIIEDTPDIKIETE